MQISSSQRTDQLARAIGSQGQNVRLASELTGYKLDMMLEESIVLVNKMKHNNI